MLKEIGDPTDIGKYFDLWREDDILTSKIITAQCRQNTNYDIVRYAAHPFFCRDTLRWQTAKIPFLKRIKTFSAN